MDLGKHDVVEGLFDGLSPAELLESLHGEVEVRKASQLREWTIITAWADAHVVTSTEGAATLTDGHLDTGVLIAGPGAPLVSEFALMELIATLERTPDGGRSYVGQVIETAWRLPRINTQVLAGHVATWRAAQVADLTRPLSPEAAAFVDAQVAFALRSCTFAQVERLVAEAVRRFDPKLAEQQRRDAADARRFDINLDQVDPNGLVSVDGVLDATDAVDLDDAIARRAKLLGRLGHDGSMDVRRSVAAGEIARNDLALDLEVVDEETGEVTTAAADRKAVLHVHLDQSAITDSTTSREGCVGRLEEARSPVSAEQIRGWLQQATSITVKPVIDLAEHVPVDSYEIPERLKERVRLRDHHCAFPGCTRHASSCDLDHAQPHAEGGPTCPCQLVPLCRRHHRAKTFSTWRYAIVEAGTYLWTTPNQRHFLVDHTGTRALDPPRRLEPQTMDQVHDYETHWPVTQVIPACPGGFEARKLAPQPPATAAKLAPQPPATAAKLAPQPPAAKLAPQPPVPPDE